MAKIRRTFSVVLDRMSSVSLVDEAAENLVRVAGKFVNNPPRSLAVIVGKYGIAHRREDGVYVIPITALGV